MTTTVHYNYGPTPRLRPRYGAGVSNFGCFVFAIIFFFALVLSGSDSGAWLPSAFL